MEEMNGRDVMNVIEAIYDESATVMERLRDVKTDIERNGGYGYAEKGKLYDLRMELDDIVYRLGKLLTGAA